MKLTVLDDADAVAVAAADRVERRVREHPEAALALPTGRTPIPFYAELGRRSRAGLDLARLRTFNLDELVLPREDPRSFHAFMVRHAWTATGLEMARADIPNGGAADLEAECDRYENAVRAASVDLALLGVGSDGHVAYNLPGDTRERTHVVRLPDELAEELEVPPTDRPLRAITMGLGTIRAARELLMLATGATKRSAIAALRHGESTAAWPCTTLLDHPHFEVLVDKAAMG